MRLHIIDSTLRDRRGHHYEYAKSLYDECASRGIGVEVYCHREVENDVCRRLHARRIFSRDVHAVSRPFPAGLRLNFIATFVSNNLVYRRELKKIDPSSLSGADVALVHTIGPTQLFGLLLWHSRLNPDNRPRLVILLRYELGEAESTRWIYSLYYRTFFRIASLMRRSGIAYASDSESLAAEFGGFARSKIHILPIPHLPEPAPGPAPRPDGDKVLVYLGDARIEKGYHLLPGMIESVLRARNDVRFIVQSNVSEDPPGEIVGAVRKMRTFPDRVAVVDRPLRSDEYYRFLNQADGVILPYCPTVYRRRTSGIFAEAMAFGKPAVVTRGTWMDSELPKFYNCGISFDYSDSSGLARAVLELLSDIDDYRRRARDASAKWRRFHNPGTYMDILMAIATDGAQARGTMQRTCDRT